jgi:hypothetical protein
MKAVQRLVPEFKASDLRKRKAKPGLDFIGLPFEFLIALFLMKGTALNNLPGNRL